MAMLDGARLMIAVLWIAGCARLVALTVTVVAAVTIAGAT
jgi:hypothetical protein